MHSPQLRAQFSSIQSFDNSHSFRDLQKVQCGWLSKQSPNTGGSGSPAGDGTVGGSGQALQLFGQDSSINSGLASHSPMSAQYSQSVGLKSSQSDGGSVGGKIGAQFIWIW